MDFFEFTSIANIFVPASADPFTALWITLVIGGVFFAVLFGLQAFAMWQISGREGFRHRWMCFVPFLNTYYLGVLSEKNPIYNAPAKRFSLALAIIEAVCFGLFVFDYACAGMVYANGLYVKVSQTDMITGLEYISGYVSSNAIAGTWLAWVFDYFSVYVLNWLNLVYVLMNVLVIISFFKTYAARYFFIYSLLSVIFPLKGLFIFLSRKNNSINYRNYVIGQQQARYKMYQQYNRQNGNPYETPFGGRNRQGNPYDNRPSGTASDPFDEFANSSSARSGEESGSRTDGESGQSQNSAPPEDPFSEF